MTKIEESTTITNPQTGMDDGLGGLGGGGGKEISDDGPTKELTPRHQQSIHWRGATTSE